MTTIKSCTDVPQSKKLAEFLPLESADMHYCLEKRDVATGYEIGITPFIKVKKYKGKCNVTDVQPAWSLAALLSLIPEVSLNTFKDGDWIVMIRTDGKMICVDKGNPVDACYEMILKLHELNLL